MDTTHIRKEFIAFFKKKQHQHVPSVPIVSHNNPSLLFVNAGMNPFTSIFLGDEQPLFPRVVNSQPCLRVTGKHNDLEEVGHDTYHHTFFEMLGNWSFGDYFKQEAIAWAWELLTEVYQIPKDRIYATVFQGNSAAGLAQDRESLRIWKNYLPEDHILYGDQKDNFWEMGPTGPCGACSEIHVDLRSQKERGRLPGRHLVNQGNPLVVEIWNLVFITYDRQANQELSPLSKPYVDTGMGLERLAMLLQNKSSTYDTDAFTPYITWLTKETNLPYGKEKNTDQAMRVIADHIRAIGFVIADGEMPSTQKAGYVIRRILRRAMRYGHSHLGFEEPFLHKMIPLLVNNFGQVYPQIQAQAPLLATTIYQEEENFLKTLSSGLKRLSVFLSKTPKNTKTLDGASLFELYDTFGFPADLTETILREKGYSVDHTGFAKAMKAQKARSQKASLHVAPWHYVHDQEQQSLFVGYDLLKTTSKVIKYRTVTSGDSLLYQLVLDKTPFYPEGGGQIGDKGTLQWPGQTIPVIDTKKEHNLILHYTKVLPQNPHLPCISTVDMGKRKNTERNHSATHLLHAALRATLGTQVVQKGSFVNEKGFRFDFAYPQKIHKQQIHTIQALVNQKIRDNIPLQEHRDIPLQEAKKRGAMSLFGEKYGESVRIVTFDPTFSTELCAGTHVQATGAIGFCQIITERAVAAGIRRIEAHTGEVAERAVNQTHDTLKAIADLLHGTNDPLKAVQLILEEKKIRQKEWKKILDTQAEHICNDLFTRFQTKQNLRILTEKVEIPNVDFLKKVGILLQKTHKDALIALATTLDNTVYLMILVGSTLLPHYNAHQLIQKVQKMIDGKGGGRATMAIARGTKTTGLEKVFSMIQEGEPYC